MAQNTRGLRASLLGDLRIIVLGTWAFFLQLLRSWRLTPKLMDRHDDEQQP
ncbi:MAG TPA: hypothetical protein VER11_30670 [Polyangiaceae bacterium]|nr:hypothetical protein [Polyangiaceae bacterium]